MSFLVTYCNGPKDGLEEYFLNPVLHQCIAIDDEENCLRYVYKVTSVDISECRATAKYLYTHRLQFTI